SSRSIASASTKVTEPSCTCSDYMNSALARSIADLSSRWRNRFSRWRTSSKSGHLRRGARGETLACRYLRRNGYKVLFRNFRVRSGVRYNFYVVAKTRLVFSKEKPVGAKNSAGPVKRFIAKNQNAFLVVPPVGCQLLNNPKILPQFALFKSTFPTARNPPGN